MLRRGGFRLRVAGLARDLGGLPLLRRLALAEGDAMLLDILPDRLDV